jgi:hypothetical protein
MSTGRVHWLLVYSFLLQGKENPLRVNKLGKNLLLRCNVSAILTKVVIQMDFYTIRKDGVGNWQE